MAASTSARGSEADELLVTVTDTGVGIPPEDRERIFESFQQGGRGVAREEGTGLGPDAVAGASWSCSAAGSGSSPRSGSAAPSASPSRVRPAVHVDRVAAGPTDRSRPTVLLVDDDRASLDLMAAYLEDASAAAGAGRATATRRSGSPARCVPTSSSSTSGSPARRLAGA